MKPTKLHSMKQAAKYCPNLGSYFNAEVPNTNFITNLNAFYTFNEVFG